MTTQSTQCASEELADIEDWLRAKGLKLVEKDESDLRPGEYVKAVNEPTDKTTGDSPVWRVTWYPEEE